MKKHLILTILTLSLVALTCVTLRLADARNRHSQPLKEASPIHLTFDQSFVGPSLCDPLFTQLAVFQGTVDGDFTGTVTTHLLGPPQIGKQGVKAQFDLIVDAGFSGEFSFTAHLDATTDLKEGEVEMSGVVTGGFLAGQQVRVRAKLVDLRAIRLKGKIRIGPGEAEDDHSDS